MKQHLADITVNVSKVWSPSAVYLAVITYASVKDIISIIGACVTIICTIWVSHSTVQKNKRSK